MDSLVDKMGEMQTNIDENHDATSDKLFEISNRWDPINKSIKDL